MNRLASWLVITVCLGGKVQVCAKRQTTHKMQLRTWLINVITHNSKRYLQGQQHSEVVENSSWQACQVIIT